MFLKDMNGFTNFPRRELIRDIIFLENEIVLQVKVSFIECMAT